MKKIITVIAISVLSLTAGFAEGFRLDFTEDDYDLPSSPSLHPLQSLPPLRCLPPLQSIENHLGPLITVVMLGAAFEECPSAVIKVVKEKNIAINLDNARQNCVRMRKQLKDFYASQGEEGEEDGKDQCWVGNSDDELAIETLLKAYSLNLLLKAEEEFEVYLDGYAQALI